MKLHEQMSDAVADVHPDTDTLTQEARERGGRIKRQRRLASIGGVAAVAILGAAIAVAVPGNDPGSSKAPVADGSNEAPPVEEPPGKVAIDGRSAAAALSAAVLEVQDGEQTAYVGQGGSDTQVKETYAELELAPTTGGGPGIVGVNVQPSSILDGFPFECTEWMVDCQIRELGDGARLRTYSDVPVPTADGDGVRVVAEYFAPERGLRVVASATNGFELPENQWDVTRSEPVLSIDQLVEVVTQDWWGFRIPARFADEGAQLTPYEERDTSMYLLSPTPESR
jgi:hypothetical protein